MAAELQPIRVAHRTARNTPESKEVDLRSRDVLSGIEVGRSLRTAGLVTVTHLAW